MSGRTPYIAAIWKAGVEVGRPTLIGSRADAGRARLGPHAVHRGHLEGRRRGRQAHAHRLEAVRVTVQQLREDRHAAVAQPLFEGSPREAVDLHDQQAALRGLGGAAPAQAADEPIDRPLERQDQPVQEARQSQSATVIRFSTWVTPGADQATRSASSRSAHDRTVPFRITLLPWTSIWIRSASVAALRTSASSIFFWSSAGGTRGF